MRIGHRIGWLFPSQIRIRELVRKKRWLEFENESILKFLSKYNVLTKMRDNHPVKSGDLAPEEINTTHQPKFDLSVIES